MNKITINNQDFVETNEIYPISDGLYYKNKWYKPVKKYKIGDWVIFNLGTGDVVRKIISNEEYDIKNSSKLNSDYREWMTERAADSNFKNIKRLATESEIKQHLSTLAKEKGLVKGAKVKRLSVLDNTTTNIVQEDDDYYIEQDEYCKSGIILYSNGKWVEKIEEPKFTFGGYEVTFKVVSSGEKYNFKTVEINCKGETGTHHQLANILTHYFRPIPFGRVFVKKWLPKKATYIDVHLGLNTFAANDDLANVEEVTIGCLTGKYKELVDIFNHCQKLLK